MYLAFNDLAELFVNFKGVQNADHMYLTVSDTATVAQPKGLFIPLNEESGELLEAIANGAIAAIWHKEKKVPHYTPNHFPVFFTDSPVEAVRDVLKFYINKIDGELAEKMNITKFVFFNKELLKENKDTYDIAVMLKEVKNINAKNNLKRRE